MTFRARIPDVTFLASVALVATVQVHYWDLAPKVAGTRQAEVSFRHLTEALFDITRPANSTIDFLRYRYFEALNDTLAILAFVLPGLAILLLGRTRRPRLTCLVLRVAAALYVAWLLVLSPRIETSILN
jgi:hypothetical protein